MRLLRMWGFHLVQFARTGYFVQLLATSTLSIVVLQVLAGRTPGSSGDGMGWLRAGMVGTWTVSTVAAGMWGFQRYQGTLVHLVRSPLRVHASLYPVVGAASLFGLGAFPLAGLASWALGERVRVGSAAETIAAIGMYWLACLSISLVVGMVFVLTPNAITFESLLSVPLVLASGVFGTPALPPAVTTSLSLLPTRSAVGMLERVTTGTAIDGASVGGWAVACALWFALAGLVTRMVMRRATSEGTLEVVG